MRRSLVTAAALLAFVAGCADTGSAARGPTGGAGSTPPAGDGSGLTLTVQTTYSPSPDGGMYIEGVLAQITLVAADGTVVDRQIKAPGEPITFTDLEAGEYEVRAALRPCDGNCGYLDPPTDGCRSALDVRADMEMRVDFIVGRHCSVEV